MQYLVHYPRNFCNEYTVYAGTSAQLGRLTKILESGRRAENGAVHRISRREAIRLGQTRVREAKRYNEQWFGGFAETGNGYPETLAEKLADAAAATEQEIDQAEAAADWAAHEFA
jgi:cation transport regulator ChaC